MSFCVYAWVGGGGGGGGEAKIGLDFFFLFIFSPPPPVKNGVITGSYRKQLTTVTEL